MKNWYKKPITKGILVLLAHVAAAVAVGCLAILMSFSGNISREDVLSEGENSYEESGSFKTLLQTVSLDIMDTINTKNNLETDGKYNPDKIVDIIAYAKKGVVTGANENGLAYGLDDLVNWSRKYVESGADSENSKIVVCERPDETYFYYHTEEFIKLVEAGELQIEMINETEAEFLKDLQNGYYASGYFGDLEIRNQENAVVYESCWTFEGSFQENAVPQGGTDIIDVINKTPELNGKLSNVFAYLRSTLESIYYLVENYQYSGDSWDEGNTNLSYIYVDELTKRVYTNNSQYKEYKDLEVNLTNIANREGNKFFIVHPKLKDFETNMDISASEWRSMVQAYQSSEKKSNFTLAIEVDTEFPIQDIFYSDKESYETYAPYIKAAFIGSIMAVILFFLFLLWMILIAGRVEESDHIQLGMFDRWKTEVAAIVVIACWVGIYYIFVTALPGRMATGEISQTYYMYAMDDYYSSGYTISSGVDQIIWIVFLTILTVTCFLFGFLSLVRRMKAKTVWNNSITYGVILFAKEFWSNKKVTSKTVITLSVLITMHWLTYLSGGSSFLVLLLIFLEVMTIYFAVQQAIAQSRIQKGIQEIASGNVDYQIPLDRLKGENLKKAEMINNIGNGLQRALEEAMRSERLKTDLITNVSHDIKTPLTSIINYVDLLKRENIENQKIQGYLNILENKAQRLKTLTEDVVEASKVSSGNITLEFMDVNFVEMIHQSAGEFENKFKEKELQLVQNLPSEAAIIHVDGRRMWRVLENIYNNAAKYAMPGTRVYSDLVVGEKKIIFTLKNISQHPLNITAEELTERFIQGDVSRSTEGSGLGLSIAKSLTNMQGGEFQLYLDGDLFKVMIAFLKK